MSNISRNMAVPPLNNLPPAREPQLNELQRIKNCNPCANGHGIFVLLHYGDLMQTEELSLFMTSETQSELASRGSLRDAQGLARLHLHLKSKK